MFSVHWIHNTVRNSFRSTLIGKISHGWFKRTSTPTVCFVSATRLSKHDFWEKSALGSCLPRWLKEPGVTAEITFENTSSLSKVYNAVLKAPKPPDIVVLLHDDVWLTDKDMLQKVKVALNRYDIVGVAGNTRLAENQPSWAFRLENGSLVWDHGHLSGIVSHGVLGASEPSVFGPAPARCQLLDGVLLVVRTDVARLSSVYFDETFDFHFYDLDFCRTARKAGLSLGTWPIELIHASGGSFGSPSWESGRERYTKKWD